MDCGQNQQPWSLTLAVTQQLRLMGNVVFRATEQMQGKTGNRKAAADGSVQDGKNQAEPAGKKKTQRGNVL